MRLLISGFCGHMGQEVAKLASANYRGSCLACGIDINATGNESVPCYTEYDAPKDSFDCIVDFSHHAATQRLVDFAVKQNKPLVIATTGQTEKELELIHNAAKKIPVFFAYNYSLGIAILTELAKKTAALMPDAEIEIIEKHHNRKIDAPSGTAISIVNAIKEVRENSYSLCGRSGQGKRTENEIGVHSIRMGDIVGVHEVIIGTKSQTITLTHEAHNRALFAEGAIVAAMFLYGKSAGLYTMKDLLDI